MNKIKKFKKSIKATILCWRFPFLKFWEEREKFWQESCWYYAVDYGWRRIALQMFEEIRRQLKLENNPLNSFRIFDIKEKNGELVVNFSGSFCSSVEKIVQKYEYISFRTCNICGEPAYGYTYKDWIRPYCYGCAPRGVDIYKFGTESNKWYDTYSLMDKGEKPVILSDKVTKKNHRKK